MHASLVLFAAAGLAAILGCQPGGENPPSAVLTQAGPAVASAKPLEVFTRFVGGRWKMTTTAGRDTYDTWSWGPGEQSIRSMRLGLLTDGEPWSTMTVYYWHPTFKEIRLLSVGSVWRGVGEGKTTFEGDRAESVFVLNQTGGPRNLRERWTFTSADNYHDELSENARGDYEVLGGWDRVRVDASAPAEPVRAPLLAPGGSPSELMRPLEKVLGDAWASVAATGTDARLLGDEPRMRTAFEYVPHTDAIYGRAEVINQDGTSSHAMDVYLYHHTGTGALRVLALRGGGAGDATVSEGDIVPAADGASIEIRLKEHRAAGEGEMEARVEFEKDGTARVRVWRMQGEERVVVVDCRYGRGRG